MEIKKKSILVLAAVSYFLLIVAVFKVLIGELYLRRASRMEGTKFWLMAIPLYERALSFDSGRIELYERLARLYFLRCLFPVENQEKIRKMEKVLLKGISICPHDASLHSGLALFYEVTNREKKAIMYYNSAISLDPNNAFYHTLLSAFYFKRGEQTKGIREAKIAASCSSPDMVYNCLRRMGIIITRDVLF